MFVLTAKVSKTKIAAIVTLVIALVVAMAVLLASRNDATVPTKDSEVFSRYNELQKSQGYDLTPYRGKTLTRYVYEVLNYPNADQPVYATLLVSEGTVVGGDITNTAPDGTMHGFRQPTA